MLPRLDAAVVTPLTPVDPVGAAAPIGDGRQAAFQRALQGMVGQQVPAAVLSKLGDGSFLVKVADNSVRMMLPGDVQVGAEIPLTVVAASPRPVFQLGNGNLPGQAALVYTDSAAAAGGEALYSAPLPSQEAPAYVPGNPRPQPNAGNAATPGQPLTGQGWPAGETEIDPATGLPRPAAPANPASAAAGTAANNAASAGNAAGAAAASKPALPASAAASAAAAASAPANAAAAPAAPAGAAAGQAGGLAAQLAAQAAGAAEVADTAGAAASQPSQQTAAAAAAAATAGAPAEGARPTSLGATLLGKAPLTPANELPDLDPNTPQSTLSSTARVLTSVLNTAQGTPGTPGALLALVGKTALFGNAAPQTAELAQKLHDAISQSGLFYESHVTEWVRGERSLPELMREPQMQRMLQNNETAARAQQPAPTWRQRR